MNTISRCLMNKYSRFRNDQTISEISYNYLRTKKTAGEAVAYKKEVKHYEEGIDRNRFYFGQKRIDERARIGYYRRI